ncbi:polysaccharide pyruvyl transferase family protein [Mammaliicoccus fleurettii]|uniref:polysaccharide pyruvyl transferase family protein n=1 Tax=Mammaliicoccus fleurettii TaxID=150056 RepID=UPI002DBA71AC|nr:polysaccharide pyruvyl transferase family protein [Mammaliicoccus fleurettii]MEB7781079.1 polysaccharide pyruvyl transferase family protein [Mammaliicoccus fleurettii]
MKKFLIRAGMNPHDFKTPQDLIERDLIGTNSGNLLYAHSLYRNITTNDSILEADKYVLDINRVKYINENYDGYIIALADAFRNDFIWQLKKMTQIIEKLQIPVYLIGVGVRAPYGTSKNDLKFDFDENVRDFINAILKKSTIVGVRGKLTADYLSNLGFRENIDHTVIGCPSMYTFGNHLKIQNLSKVDEETKITTNLSKKAPLNVLQFIRKTHKNYPNAAFIPQGYDEFKLMYTGVQVFNEKNYPSSITDIEYENGKSKFYINANTWIKDFRENDFAIGTKLHGNIAATISGVPSISIPLDARMKELVHYHGLSHILPEDIQANTNINDLLKSVDIHSAERKQSENYNHFIEFLNENDLPYFYQDESNYDNTPYDQLIEKIKLYPPISAFNSEETNIKERINNIVIGNEKRIRNMNSLIKKQRTQLQK